MASPDPQASSRLLNPQMVYRPASPAHAPNDGDGGNKPVKIPFNLVLVHRALLVVFTITGIVVDITNHASAVIVVAIVTQFFCLFWNLFFVLRWIHKTLVKATFPCHWLPRFSCQIGRCKWACGGGHDDDEEEARRPLLDEGEDPPKKRSRPLWLVDVLFAVLILIFVLADMEDYLHNRWWYGPREPIHGLLWVVL